jgi:hypothetical protein
MGHTNARLMNVEIDLRRVRCRGGGVHELHGLAHRIVNLTRRRSRPPLFLRLRQASVSPTSSARNISRTDAICKVEGLRGRRTRSPRLFLTVRARRQGRDFTQSRKGAKATVGTIEAAADRRRFD